LDVDVVVVEREESSDEHTKKKLAGCGHFFIFLLSIFVFLLVSVITCSPEPSFPLALEELFCFYSLASAEDVLHLVVRPFCLKEMTLSPAEGKASAIDEPLDKSKQIDCSRLEVASCVPPEQLEPPCDSVSEETALV